MPDIDDRRVDMRGAQQAMEIVNRIARIGGARRGVAETVSGAVIGAGARNFCDLALDMAPDHHAVARTGFEHHGRLALPHAEQVEAVCAVDGDELLRMCVGLRRHHVLGLPAGLRDPDLSQARRRADPGLRDGSGLACRPALRANSVSSSLLQERQI